MIIVDSEYSKYVLQLFDNPKCLYAPGSHYDLMGHSGDLEVGEYVHLYFDVPEINRESPLDSRIVEIRFSAIGGVILIGVAEKLCQVVDDNFGMSISGLLKYCGSEELTTSLGISSNRVHSVNFVIQAVYNMIENLMAICNDTTR